MENPFDPVVQAKEWREKREQRELPGTVPEDLYWAIDELLKPRHEPQFFARGSEHLVFRLKNKGFVVKINYQESWWAYQALSHHDPASLEQALRHMEMGRREYRKRLKELEMFFGREAVPRQRVLLAQVPVSSEVANALGTDVEEGEGPAQVPAWVLVQRAVELDPKKTVALGGYYLEQAVLASDEPQDLENYGLIHDALADPKSSANKPLVMRLEHLMDDLKIVIAKLEGDPSFKPALQETVRQMIEYSATTGETMDLAGRDNVVLVQSGGGWKLKLLDPLASSDCGFGDLRQAAQKLAEGEELDDDEAARAHFAMNTLRVINALAMISGITERLDMPEVRRVSAKRWFEVLSEVKI
jgi:hypothetical protein